MFTRCHKSFWQSELCKAIQSSLRKVSARCDYTTVVWFIQQIICVYAMEQCFVRPHTHGKWGQVGGCTVPDTFLYIFWWIFETYWAHRDWLPYWSSLLWRVGLCGRCCIIKPYRIWTAVIDWYMWKNSLLSTTLHLTQERLCVLILGHGIS